jgi:hypothetical protein
MRSRSSNDAAAKLSFWVALPVAVALAGLTGALLRCRRCACAGRTSRWCVTFGFVERIAVVERDHRRPERDHEHPHPRRSGSRSTRVAQWRS